MLSGGNDLFLFLPTPVSIAGKSSSSLSLLIHRMSKRSCTRIPCSFPQSFQLRAILSIPSNLRAAIN